MIKRYTPELDWTGCYYEGDTPYTSMEESQFGDWVAYSQYEALHKANLHLVDINNQAIGDIKELQSRLGALQAKIDELMLEFTPDEMTPDQLHKYSEHQRPV